MANPRKNAPRRVKKNVPAGIVHIQATFNNTIVTVSDQVGNTVSWSSAGVRGFKGSRKSTPFAAQMAAERAGRAAQECGVKSDKFLERVWDIFLHRAVKQRQMQRQPAAAKDAVGNVALDRSTCELSSPRRAAPRRASVV